MSDTVRLPRPSFDRRRRKGSGRVEHDGRGNAVLVRTRASDGEEMAIDASLEIVEEGPPADCLLRPAVAGRRR